MLNKILSVLSVEPTSPGGDNRVPREIKFGAFYAVALKYYDDLMAKI